MLPFTLVFHSAAQLSLASQLTNRPISLVQRVLSLHFDYHSFYFKVYCKNVNELPKVLKPCKRYFPRAVTDRQAAAGVVSMVSCPHQAAGRQLASFPSECIQMEI